MERCALCPGVNACIPPDDPGDADVLFIGEAPGPQEDRNAKKHPPGIPFIGKTGEEVNRHYLPLAGLRRDRVTFTNAIRCLPTSAGGKLDSGRRADQELLRICAEAHLYPLIEQSRWRALIPLGAFACRAVFGEAFDLELRHGIPHESPWGIPAFPMYHPALGIHEPKKMLYLRTDWGQLRKFLNGTLQVPDDDYQDVDYREATDCDIENIDPSRPIACDTESQRTRTPYCFTFSQQAGTGRLLTADRQDLLARLNARLRYHDAPILFHNWLYDYDPVAKLGLQLPMERIVDTMLVVFHLGNLPQGLKALAFRELGMVMEDFEDVVSPYSRELVTLYYQLAQTKDWPKPEPKLEQESKTGLWKLKRPQSMKTKLKRFFTDLANNPEKDPFKMFEENWIEDQRLIEQTVGPYPGMCISHVPFEKTLYYACRDVDALIRLWPLLQRMRRAMRKVSQEHWRL